MTNSKHGLKALVLAAMAAALGLMAFAAVGAQAETAGAFLINLGNALLATVAGVQKDPGKLLVEERKIEIKCAKGEVAGGEIHSNTDGLATSITFTECGTYTHNGTIMSDCLFKGESPNLTTTTLKTNPVLLLPLVKGGTKYVVAEPATAGGPFITVSYHAGLGCVLPLNNPVAGKVAAELDPGVVATLLFSEAIQKAAGNNLLFGVFPAFVNSSATAELTGGHATKKLSIQ